MSRSIRRLIVIAAFALAGVLSVGSVSHAPATHSMADWLSPHPLTVQR